jgi:diacylglycerol kinase family enzyme
LTTRIPALVNSKAGSADDVLKALREDTRFDIQKVEPDKLVEHIATLVRDGTPRILVSGGDGTLASSAGAFTGTDAEMAILPGGTLNHFAKRIGLPEDHTEALEVAASADASPQDVGMLNEHVFLNTSSIGAYVMFVRTRDHLEEKFHLPYYVASFFAALRMLAKLPTVRVEVDVDGERIEYVTPLLYIGVGERETKGKSLGQPKEDGKRGLHLLVVRGRARARLFALALAAATRGRSIALSPHVDSFLVDSCRIVLTGGKRTVALDGELKEIASPLEYTIARDALKVVGATPATS